ncbi:LLM class flavin-dependent oxidoreductase [Cereibacter sphaeroides]|uniref:LLM class flavin-dependent oxidoreductase n=2 Tax=Cereibacter sphaeroides TaxID=1063 RepID=A0AAX1UQE4_CERSP|nr:LLM class flavin-dependent oxidoreductase [Cereibacter sphaeroides]
MHMTLEFGLDTFGDVTWDAERRLLPQREVLRNVVEEAVLADEVGVDAIGLGEHHRDDFAISSPEILLASIGARTRRIRLGTAVTVLGSDDPVRLFQRLSTLDALTGGRAEVTLGRGSFTESFPLFGFDLGDYHALFEEKLDLFARLIREEEVTWSGTTRAPLERQRVWPPLGEAGLRAWIGVGGSPESVVRAVRFRLPMILAIIGGPARRFLPYADLYRRATDQAGLEPMPLGVHSPGHIAPTDEQAREEAFPAYKVLHGRLGAERGWPSLGRDDFLREVEHGSMYVGSPETVARKIADTVGALGLSRFQLKYSMGPLAHGALLRSVDLYGREVIPRVRELLAAG